MTAGETKLKLQELLGIPADRRAQNIGPLTRDAFKLLARTPNDAEWPPGTEQQPFRLTGDGTWKWYAELDGPDIIVRRVRATCFGGVRDPQDSGETASGVSTKPPRTLGCALPMDGRMFRGLTKAEHRALDGSPIPRMPWRTMVEVSTADISFEVPVIDLGPHKRTGNAIDLTVAAARLINPKATATNFEAIVDYRILGGAQYVPPGAVTLTVPVV